MKISSDQRFLCIHHYMNSMVVLGLDCTFNNFFKKLTDSYADMQFVGVI